MGPSTLETDMETTSFSQGGTDPGQRGPFTQTKNPLTRLLTVARAGISRRPTAFHFLFALDALIDLFAVH